MFFPVCVFIFFFLRFSEPVAMEIRLVSEELILQMAERARVMERSREKEWNKNKKGGKKSHKNMEIRKKTQNNFF